MSATEAVSSLPVRVYWEDTDAGGIVYYANYLRFAERGRSEWMRERGLGQVLLRDEYGIMFVVRDCHITYRQPARLDDLLLVETEVLTVRGAKIAMRQSIRRDGQDLAVLELTLACLRLDGRPARIPPPVHALITPPSADNGF